MIVNIKSCYLISCGHRVDPNREMLMAPTNTSNFSRICRSNFLGGIYVS